MKRRLGLCILGLASLIWTTSSGCDDEPLPRVSPSECEARGGHAIGDPGDGSSYRNGCPSGEHMIATLEFGFEGGICCARLLPF